MVCLGTWLCLDDDSTPLEPLQMPPMLSEHAPMLSEHANAPYAVRASSVPNTKAAPHKYRYILFLLFSFEGQLYIMGAIVYRMRHGVQIVPNYLQVDNDY